MSDRAQSVESQIKELKVSGHTMTLEPGLYCVYNTPGGPAVNDTGLPGVRITAAPRGGQGRISVSTFTADGWIGVDSAALVRVAQGRADLLVTVYQAKDSQTEAPKLQVVLLSAAAAPAAPPAPTEALPQSPPPAPAQPEAIAPTSGKTEVVAHVYGAGDVACGLGEWIGEPGSQRWIEGFGVAPPEGIEAADVEYQAVLGRGWLSPWSQGGQFCGSRGMSLPILGLRVRLRGEAAKSHRIVLSASFVDGSRVGPMGDGEPCEAANLSALEAFQLTLEPLSVTTAKEASQAAPGTPVRGRKAKAPVAKAPMAKPPVAERAVAEPAPPPAPAPVKASKTRTARVAAETVKTPPPAKPTRRPGKVDAPETAPVPVAPMAVTPVAVAPTAVAPRGKPGRKPKAAAPVKTSVHKPAKPAAPPATLPKAKPAARAPKRTPATTRRR